MCLISEADDSISSFQKFDENFLASLIPAIGFDQMSMACTLRFARSY